MVGDTVRRLEFGVAKKQAHPAPRRTREHVIASQSFNYVEKFFIDKGHTVDRPTDYGFDMLVTTFDESGYAENGDIKLQLKARESLGYSKDGSWISVRVEAQHYSLWINDNEQMPVFLILFDAKSVRAFWLYVQAYFSAEGVARPRRNARSVTLRVPVKNRLTGRTVDYMRHRKAAILKQTEGRFRHEG